MLAWMCIGVRPARSDQPRLGDDIWMISSRCLPPEACRAILQSPTFPVSHYDGERQMLPSDLESLLATIRTDAETHNVFYVHGNNFKAHEVLERAWFVHRKIHYGRQTQPPMRFIIWSWPSEPVTTLLKDVRLKAARTDAQGLYLATVLRQMSDIPAPTTLIGYSFGGRVVTGSLHALAGGRLGGRSIPGDHIQGFHAKVGLVAPALNSEWLTPCEYHGLASKNMDRLVLMFNPRDRVLQKYWILDPFDLESALGATGDLRPGRRADGTCLPVTTYNCSSTNGRRHLEEDYYGAKCGAGCVFARLIDSP